MYYVFTYTAWVVDIFNVWQSEICLYCLSVLARLHYRACIKVVFPDMYSGIMAKRKFEALFYLITHNESNLVIKELFVFI